MLKFELYLFYNDYETSLILIMLVGTDVCVRMAFVWEQTHLSDLVTK